MAMNDWTINNNWSNNAAQNGWVYYVANAAAIAVNAAWQNMHISRYAFDVYRDHVATNNGQFYYFGNTNSFNVDPQQIPAAIRDALVAAWANFYTV